MFPDEEKNAVRQLGELIGYPRLISLAMHLRVEKPPPVDLSRGRCVHRIPLNEHCEQCAQQTPGA